MNSMRNYAPLVLRVGLSLVFFWFASQQFMNPQGWVGFLPSITKSFPISQVTFIYLNAWFEITFGILLLIGFYKRYVALLLALHLLGIVITVGISPIGVRDFGLFIATFSLFLHGQSIWSLDSYFSARSGYVSTGPT